MAGACSQHYEEIFGKQFNQTLLCLNCGDHFALPCILYKLVYTESKSGKVSSICVYFLTNAQELSHFVGFRTEIQVK
jgi:hypothetical protein